MYQEVWPPSHKPQVAQIFSIPKRTQDHSLPRATGRIMGASPPRFAPLKLLYLVGIKYPLNVRWVEAGRWLYLTPRGHFWLFLGSWHTGSAWGTALPTSSAGEGRWARQSPSPAGREMIFAVTHLCAAFGGRGSSFGEWESLCYFLFTGFSRCLFPPGGQWFWKPKCSLFVARTFFFPFLMKTESLVFAGETGKWRRGERGKEKLILGRDGLCTGYPFSSQNPTCLEVLMVLKGGNISTWDIWEEEKGFFVSRSWMDVWSRTPQPMSVLPHRTQISYHESVWVNASPHQACQSSHQTRLSLRPISHWMH